jgi:hypothetical protein
MFYNHFIDDKDQLKYVAYATSIGAVFSVKQIQIGSNTVKLQLWDTPHTRYAILMFLTFVAILIASILPSIV